MKYAANMRNVAALLMLPLLLLATAVSAQAIYKHTDAGGHVLYTDQPDPAARTMTSLAESPDARRPPARHGNLVALAFISPERNAEINANEAARRVRQERRKPRAPLGS